MTTHDSIRAGLYVGPVLLGVFLADGVYHTVCEGRTFAFAGLGTPMAPFFLAVTAYFVIKVRTHLERAAWVTWAVFFAISTLAWIGTIPPTSAAGWLSGAAGILFTAVGLRHPTTRKIGIATVILLLAFTLVLFAQRYASTLGGRGSVFAAGPICA